MVVVIGMTSLNIPPSKPAMIELATSILILVGIVVVILGEAAQYCDALRSEDTADPDLGLECDNAISVLYTFKGVFSNVYKSLAKRLAYL
eukprot:9045443-Heterocapsa_arctica.AAC.1